MTNTNVDRSFQQQINAYASQNIPFFFIIDFEKQKPIICPLSEAAQYGIYYQVGELNNRQQFNKNHLSAINELGLNTLELNTLGVNSKRSNRENIDWKTLFSMQPIPLETYRAGFNLVKQQIQYGNCYLLNLTYPTPLHLTTHQLQSSQDPLPKIFKFSDAKYKLLYKDQFVCFSPEPFVKIEGNQISTYPMKGTISAEIPGAEQKLMNSEKERWEHNTIVDLMRNDLAMVAENIKVTRFRYCERLETNRGVLLQTSSEIMGQLSTGWKSTLGDLLYTLLPAGSISGAPKLKTLSIIQQAEQQERGYYTGIFGVFDGKGVQSAVIIRYIEKKESGYQFRSGGGITSKSQLDDEYQELLQKVYIPFSTN